MHWGSILTTTKGREFDATKEVQCETVSTSKPTYWPTDPKKNVINFFIIRSTAWKKNGIWAPITRQLYWMEL